MTVSTLTRYVCKSASCHCFGTHLVSNLLRDNRIVGVYAVDVQGIIGIDSRIIPGAAATEIELAKRLKEFFLKETG